MSQNAGRSYLPYPYNYLLEKYQKVAINGNLFFNYSPVEGKFNGLSFGGYEQRRFYRCMDGIFGVFLHVLKEAINSKGNLNNYVSFSKVDSNSPVAKFKSC